jgi:hypothetical protein
LGALAHLKPIQEIAKLMYFLTGASTERQAVLALQQDQPRDAGATRETAISPRRSLTPIKQQEAGPLRLLPDVRDAMIQDKMLKPGSCS